MGKITDYTKMELLETNDPAILLTRNGKMLICPYSTRLIVPGTMAGTANVQQVPCSTVCPHFEIIHFPKENTDKCRVVLNCCNTKYNGVDFIPKSNLKIN